MKIFPKKPKSTPYFGYWGEYGEVVLGISMGCIIDNDIFPGEKLHYHLKGTMYFIVLDGSGFLEVDGKEVLLQKDTMCEVSPGEQYRILRANEVPFSWLVVCTSNSVDDKVIMEI